MPGNIIFEIEDIKVERGGHVAIDIPHLALRRGLTYALMGPNGAGKSTLLHALNRLEKPSSGTVTFNGQNLYANGDAGMDIQRRMTLVMQPPLLFDATVFDNVAYGLRARRLGKKEISERVGHYLERVGLSGFGRRKARRLSGGEAQRVAIARALAIQPEALLLDEPTTFIDRGQANFIESLIDNISSRHTMTIIFATHNIRQAHRLADEVINIHRGRIVASDMINLFRGEIRREDGGDYFDTGRLKIRIHGNADEASYISVDPRLVEISTQKPAGMQTNFFRGRVTRIEDLEWMVQVAVDIGERLVAQLPRDTYMKNQMFLDSPVWIVFSEKALKTF